MEKIDLFGIFGGSPNVLERDYILAVKINEIIDSLEPIFSQAMNTDTKNCNCVVDAVGTMQDQENEIENTTPMTLKIKTDEETDE